MPIAVHVRVDATMPVPAVVARTGDDVLVLMLTGLSCRRQLDLLLELLSWEEIVAYLAPEPIDLLDLDMDLHLSKRG